MPRLAISSLSALGLLAVLAAAGPARSQNLDRLRGAVKIDGSSTVYPITEAVAEEFAAVAPRVRVTVGISGTGGGFKRFTAGETDISDASRPIKKKELEQAERNGVAFLESPRRVRRPVDRRQQGELLGRSAHDRPS